MGWTEVHPFFMRQEEDEMGDADPGDKLNSHGDCITRANGLVEEPKAGRCLLLVKITELLLGS